MHILPNSTCHIYKIDDDNTYTLILTGAAEWFFLLGKQTINAAFKNCPIQKYQSIDVVSIFPIQNF